MRLLRSIALCAVALMACAITTVPASASVPIDPGIQAVTASARDYPASFIANVQLVAAVAESTTAAPSSCIVKPAQQDGGEMRRPADIVQRSAPDNSFAPPLRC